MEDLTKLKEFKERAQKLLIDEGQDIELGNQLVDYFNKRIENALKEENDGR